jgi:hypothetical protein
MATGHYFPVVSPNTTLFTSSNPTTMAATWPYFGTYPTTPSQVSTGSTGRLRADVCRLQICQGPSEALVSKAGKGRTAIDPPPVVQLMVTEQFDPQRQWQQNPHLFLRASLTKEDGSLVEQSAMMGSLVSSLSRLKDAEGHEGGYFVFGDMSIKTVGTFKLNFTLYEMVPEMNAVQTICSAASRPFKVVSVKDYKSPETSTYLTMAFADQGVRLKIRKMKRKLSLEATGNKRGRQSSPEEAAAPPKKIRAQQEEGRMAMAGMAATAATAQPQPYNMVYTPSHLQWATQEWFNSL